MINGAPYIEGGRNRMNILSKDFLSELKSAIVDVIFDAVQVLIKNQQVDRRYLKKREALKYIDSKDPNLIDQMVKAGLPKISFGENGGSLRFDKQDIDTFMAKHKV